MKTHTNKYDVTYLGATYDTVQGLATAMAMRMLGMIDMPSSEPSDWKIWELNDAGEPVRQIEIEDAHWSATDAER